jgi:D-alanyl-D-alanine carboxypeptidase
MKSLGLPGVSVALGKRGQPIIAKGYGYASLTSCQLVSSDTSFQIGSVTKQFTAAAILKLAASGALSIDDAVTNFLPAYNFDSRITVRMLLNQTSGLADYTSFSEASAWTQGVSEQTVLTQISSTTVMFVPGTAYSYSNSNYFVLGGIIEALSGVPYPQYLTEQIYPSAGLTSTQYTQPSQSAAAYSNGANPAAVADPSFEFSAGALWSNVSDLTKWDGALYDFQVVSSASFSLMITPPAVPAFQSNAPSNYGMGWARGMAVGHDFVWHDGMTSGYGAFNGLFLDDGFSISILTNSAADGSAMEHFALAILSAVCADPATADNC